MRQGLQLAFLMMWAPSCRFRCNLLAMSCLDLIICFCRSVLAVPSFTGMRRPLQMDFSSKVAEGLDILSAKRMHKSVVGCCQQLSRSRGCVHVPVACDR